MAETDQGWKGSKDHSRKMLSVVTIKSLACADSIEKGEIVRSLYALGALTTGSDPMMTKGFDLKGVDLKGADLRMISLVEADLESAILSGRTILTDADLSLVHASESDLRCAEARGAILVGARLVNADLRYAVLSGAVVDDTTMMMDTKVFGAKLDDGILDQVDGEPDKSEKPTHCE